jgi:hypothetical protein
MLLSSINIDDQYICAYSKAPLIARTYAKGQIDLGVQLLIVMNFEGGWEFELQRFIMNFGGLHCISQF